jgi:hypothetical protein
VVVTAEVLYNERQLHRELRYGIVEVRETCIPWRVDGYNVVDTVNEILNPLAESKLIIATSPCISELVIYIAIIIYQDPIDTKKAFCYDCRAYARCVQV